MPIRVAVYILKCVRYSQQTQNICIPFIQCRPNVFDVGQMLYKCFAFAGLFCIRSSVGSVGFRQCSFYVLSLSGKYASPSLCPSENSLCPGNVLNVFVFRPNCRSPVTLAAQAGQV